MLLHYVDRDRWTYVPSSRALTVKGQEFQLTPKQAGVLETLTESAGEVVTRDTILDRVWDGEPVSDELLSRAVADLRKMLCDDSRRPRYIATVPRRGYRWIGEQASPMQVANPPASRFARKRVRGISMAAASLVGLSCVVTGLFRPVETDALESSPQWDWDFSTQITFEAGHEVSPDIHDGRVVYAASQTDGSTDLFLRDARDEGSPVRLTATKAHESAPVWSPDGERIAFAAQESGACHVVVLTLENRSLEAVAACAGPLVGRTVIWSESEIIHPAILAGPAGQAVALYATRPGQSSRQLTHPRAGEIDASPARSADGALIFYRTRRGDGSGKLMVSDGSGERVLAAVNGPVLALSQPESSGHGLAVVRKDGRWGLWQYDLAGRMKLLRAMPVRGLSVDLDGTLVVSEVALDYDIYAAPARGGKASPVIASTAHDTTPTPNPVTDQFAYVARRGDDWSVFLAANHGENPRQLPGYVAQGARLAWRADGQRLSYVAQDHGAYRLIEVDDRGELQSVEVFADPVRHPAYRPEGGRVVACEVTGQARICDVYEGGKLVPVAGLEGAWPRPTPHGLYAYRAADRGLYRLNSAGAVARLGSFSQPPGTHWDMDESALTILQCPTPDRTLLWRVQLESGTRTLLAEYQGLGQVMQPVLDLANDRLLFSRPSRSDSDLRLIAPTSLAHARTLNDSPPLLHPIAAAGVPTAGR